jgi:hypothetical protein
MARGSTCSFFPAPIRGNSPSPQPTTSSLTREGGNSFFIRLFQARQEEEGLQALLNMRSIEKTAHGLRCYVPTHAAVKLQYPWRMLQSKYAKYPLVNIIAHI